MHFSFTQNPLSLEMSGRWVCVVNLQAVQKKHKKTHLIDTDSTQDVYSQKSHMHARTHPHVVSKLWLPWSSDRR